MFSENYFSICIGDYSEVESPVPIPNTVVKHFSAENSVSEDRTLPILFLFNKDTNVSFFIVNI